MCVCSGEREEGTRKGIMRKDEERERKNGERKSIMEYMGHESRKGSTGGGKRNKGGQWAEDE